MENETRILEETIPLQLRTRDAIARNRFAVADTAIVERDDCTVSSVGIAIGLVNSFLHPPMFTGP